MKVSGFTFIRNAVKFDFPVVEAIASVLPLVDEFVVNVGKSEDQTLALIRTLDSPKIRIVESVWDESLQEDGKIFGIQQDIALSHCTGDWALLVQADEVLHEEDYPAIQHAMRQYIDDPTVLGLVFRMVHFKGDYWSLDPWMYRKATRIVGNRCGIRSTTDCCDFRTETSPQMLKSGPYGRLIPARMFHYGWVKPSTVLKEKLQFQISRHEGTSLSSKEIALRATIYAEFPIYHILKDYPHSHPSVMQPRVVLANRLAPRRNRWLNWQFYREVFRRGFKG